MLTFLDFFISSFSQLLSSPSFTLMANKSVHAALNPSDSSQDDSHSLWAVERHLRHVELESSLRASLLKSSSPKHLTPHSHSDFVPTPPVPANSPFLTPSNSFPLLQDTLAFHPTSPSTTAFDLSSDSSDYPDDEIEGFDSHDILLPKVVGLGITGISKHDGSGQFDGIGLVSIHRWIPRSAPRTTYEPNYHVAPFQLSETFPHDDGDLELSDTFLQEVAMSFIQDPLHTHSLATIPECESWSELGAGEAISDERALPVSDQVSTLKGDARMKKHFSASTISSELKRTSGSPSMKFGGTRTRSSTWPNLARSRLHQVKPRDHDAI